MEIVFSMPHIKYDSYTDFRRLAELNFEVCSVDDINVNRNAVYFVAPHNGEVSAALNVRKKPRNCKVVSWFLERPAGMLPVNFVNRIKELLETEFDYIVFSDKAMFSLVKHLSGTYFVPCGSDERLGCVSNHPKVYDFCHMSYVWGRRSFINNINAKIGENCWGDARHNVLQQSKFMLNVHQDNDKYHEPLRFALCAAYAMPIISEECFDAFPYVAGVDYITVDYKNLERRMVEIKNQYDGHKYIGENLFNKATKEFKFENNVKRFVESL